MAKRNKRKPFEAAPEPVRQKAVQDKFNEPGGAFAFFRDHGVRETIESIIVAVVLALMFRAYEAEAFIIPTGSMAPSLQGQHMDVECDECGFQYRAGASQSASTVDPALAAIVTKTYCPICRYGMAMRGNKNRDHRANNGDRILVNKFVYDFKPPERFDVIVFKNPNNGKQNYIKRLTGLPGDRLLIENGDLFNFVDDGSGQLEKQIIRKPADKIDVMLQLVDDTHYIAKAFKKAGWPSRWNQWRGPEPRWSVNESAGKDFYTIDQGEPEQGVRWLRYRHLAPRSAYDEYVIQRVRSANIGGISSERPSEWDLVENGDVPPRIEDRTGSVAPGALIRDYYEYNDRRYQYLKRSAAEWSPRDLSEGAHWVGDLGVECDVEVKSDTGTLVLDLVEGGAHFQCSIDLATGEATLSVQGDAGNVIFDGPENTAPTSQTDLKGRGSYNIRYAHVDDKLYLWINNRYVDFEFSTYTKKNNKRPVPQYSASDAGDAEPAGIGSLGATLRVNRLRVLRDIYYVAPDQPEGLSFNIRNETGVLPYDLLEVYENPNNWVSPAARQIFDRPQSFEPRFVLLDGQYMPMGDNSPQSQDARIWGGEHFVEEDLLIGRAMFIYWPHSLNRPIPYFPNFGKMGFIR